MPVACQSRAVTEPQREKARAHLAGKRFDVHCRFIKSCGCGNTAMPYSATGSGIAVFSQYNNPPPKSLDFQGFSDEVAF